MSNFFTLLLLGQLLLGSPEATELQEPSAPSPPPPYLLEQVELSAESVLIVEMESGMPLYAKNAKEERAVASLTKLMTALLLLEQGNLSRTTFISQEAASIEGSQAKLLSGEELYLDDLLEALLIKSANDAAIAIAQAHSGNTEAFVQQMNHRAAVLGMEQTHYQNPHGLDELDHYSSAFDLSLLARKLLEYQQVRPIVGTPKAVITDTTGAFEHELQTTNELLLSPFPISGLKTGTTDEAGQCFIGLMPWKGKEYLIIVLGSENRFQDTKALIWAMEQAL